MVEKDQIIKEKIKYVGLGDFGDIYKFARDWFWKEDFNLIEEGYTEKIKPSGKDLELLWTASKKVTDYFKISIKLKWVVFGMSDVEVEIDGRKKKMNKFVELGIEIRGILEKDYNSRWEVNSWLKFFKEVYNKYVIPQRIDQKEDQTKDFVQDFKEEMKAFLELSGRK